jgi:hypothetical protein
MTKPNSQEMPNDKAQMSNQAQSPRDKELDFNDRGVALAFKHLDFNWHLDFDIWNLLRQLQKSGKGEDFIRNYAKDYNLYQIYTLEWIPCPGTAPRDNASTP